MDLMELSRIEREIRKEFPSFSIVPKSSSRLMKAINLVLLVVSFGQLRNFKRFTTTLGATVYVPDHWLGLEPVSRAAVLRHEAVHMRQARRYGRFWFSFLYLFVLFPVGLAYFRAKFEKEAYEESLRAYHEYGVDITGPSMRQNILKHFTGSAYLWMWPFKKSLETWYAEAVARTLGTVRRIE